MFDHLCRRLGRTVGPRLATLTMAVGLTWTVAAPAQIPADQAADMLLGSARKAYNEQNYPFAVTRFREFLAKHGNHKDAPAARYGLALALLEGPDRDCTAALEQLQPLAGNKAMPEHPFVLYYLGLSQRGLGVRELAQAAAKPQEAAPRRSAAQQRFGEAAKHFAAASAAFTAQVKAPAETREVPIDLEWAARARCDQAEMEVRLHRAKEAQTTAAPFLKDALLTKTRYRGLGLYYHGFASFLLQDYDTAGRSLNLLTPFDDPVFGTHARYLLGRVHHLSEELAEAGGHYEGVLADHARLKQAAVEALKRPDTFKNDPEEKSRLESLVRDPPPDHVARATFYSGVLLYEGGKFAEAQDRFASFAKLYPGSPLLPEAQLRQGFCQVQLKDHANAVNTLKALSEKEQRLADQALLWLARAQIGAADVNNVPAFEQALRAGIDTLRRAAERAQQLTNSDPEAKTRRAEVLLELADTQQLAKQHKEAAATYEQLLNEKALPTRSEELLQRQIAALHLASDFTRSDQLCDRFRQQHPQSPLLAAVLFRYAENAYYHTLAQEKNASLPDRVNTLARLNDETARRYQAVIDRFPEYEQIHFARYGLGMVLYRKGEYEKARKAFESIPAQDRTGELALTSYSLADCLIRLAPARADDALAAGQLQELLQAAAEALEAFVNAQPRGPQAPDALLKLGYCHQRLAGLLVQPPERAKVLASAHATYERLTRDFPQHPLAAQAIHERARCFALGGNKGEAVNQLRRFTADPLKNTTVAPLAVVQLATLLREQNKGDEAAELLADCRQQHEAALLKDPERAAWATLLQYHQGVALREAGKLAEARTIFDQVSKQGGGRPEAVEASLRWGQCLHQEGVQKTDAARKKLATANLKPEESAAASKELEEGLKNVRDAVAHFEKQAEQLKAKEPPSEARARMLYEAAWGCRALAEPEVAAARVRMQQERLKKLHDEIAKKSPQRPPVAPPLPDVPLVAIPLQPSEQKARGHYQALIAAFPDLPLASDARFELAELHADREEHDAAIKLLNEAIDKEPPPDLTAKVRLRLGACLAAKKDLPAALAQLTVVAQDVKNPLAGQAQYRAGECLLGNGDYAQAVARLDVFRDKAPFNNLPGLTDRALLRLGHAHAHLKQWNESRQAHEQVVGRYPSSPWAHEARYGIGWAWQNLKQYDNAVTAYGQVTSATATETGARAQLQIGLCRLEQKRHADAANALLVVPYVYDYPELSAVALCEAARALVELKQTDQAQKLLQRVIKDHPDSKWAEVARERLTR